MAREYPDYPVGGATSAEFNQYLRDYNNVIFESRYWLIIENSYIMNELVCWHKTVGVEYIWHLGWKSFYEIQQILRHFQEYKVYINSNVDKSVSNRLHLHIVIGESTPELNELHKLQFIKND